MTLKELDDKLNSPGFQDPENGDLCYNFFIYQYPADKEYDIRRQIQEFKANLIRPINYVDVLTLNLFEEFCHFLDQKKFLRHPSMLKYLMEKEQRDPSIAKIHRIRLPVTHILQSLSGLFINVSLTISPLRTSIVARTFSCTVSAVCIPI